MDPATNMNQRSLQVDHMYAILVGMKIGLLQVTVEMSEPTPENKIWVVISATTIVMNFIATKWKLTRFDHIEHNHWRAIIFDVFCTFTETLFFCSILTMLASKGFPWYNFPITCMVVTLVEGANVIRFVFIWFYQKITNAISSVIEKLSVLILRGQQQIND